MFYYYSQCAIWSGHDQTFLNPAWFSLRYWSTEASILSTIMRLSTFQGVDRSIFYTSWGLLFLILMIKPSFQSLGMFSSSQISCIRGWRVFNYVSSAEFKAHTRIQPVPPDFPLLSVFIALLISSFDGSPREMLSSFHLFSALPLVVWMLPK